MAMWSKFGTRLTTGIAVGVGTFSLVGDGGGVYVGSEPAGALLQAARNKKTVVAKNLEKQFMVPPGYPFDIQNQYI
jgi:hypothetical protein